MLPELAGGAKGIHIGSVVTKVNGGVEVMVLYEVTEGRPLVDFDRGAQFKHHEPLKEV